jgi:hypothetical protein
MARQAMPKIAGFIPRESGSESPLRRIFLPLQDNNFELAAGRARTAL